LTPPNGADPSPAPESGNGDDPEPIITADPSAPTGKARVVTAKYPNHLWHVDLTVVPTGLGLWCSWLPFALPQLWPFCWWVAIALDHYSRRVMGFAAFNKLPASEAMRAFLGGAIHTAGAVPKHLVTDQGIQFKSGGFAAWCKRKGIQQRFGAIGQHGSIAVIERYFLTLKSECCRETLVPYRRENLLRELRFFGDWYNEFRPHVTLKGRTPDEVYHGKRRANGRPRFEPRQQWPRGSPLAAGRQGNLRQRRRQPGLVERGVSGWSLSLVSIRRARHLKAPFSPNIA
jgi:transposase InsO family protein